ncbi:WXG100 family type VII secretion target [Streptomyces sp. NPDC093228]|uniref:WXG100 family type VII secretion target n=1 Tax=Streptomyces sp. NPDC093228 TaxID=3155070 RepID=UPI003433A33E
MDHSGKMTLAEFRVALGDLRRAIGIVRKENMHISELLSSMQRHFVAAHASWQSPSATSFEAMSEWFTKGSRDLENLLQEMVRRMQAAYDNYLEAERANTKNSGG